MRSIMIHQEPNFPIRPDDQTMFNNTLHHIHNNTIVAANSTTNSTVPQDLDSAQKMMNFLGQFAEPVRICCVIILCICILTLFVLVCTHNVRDCKERRRKQLGQILPERDMDLEAPIMLRDMRNQRMGNNNNGPSSSGLRSWRQTVRDGEHTRVFKDALDKQDEPFSPPGYYHC